MSSFVWRPGPLRALALAVCIAAAAAHAQEPATQDPDLGSADATITFRGRSASVGVGFSWGASTVEFQGKTYPVRVDGFVLGALGTASMEGRGHVYNLTKIEDLNGDYTALVSGITVGRGVGTLGMRNDKGVIIRLRAESTGLQVGLGPRGITLEVGEAGGEPAYAGMRLPQTLGFGEAKFGDLTLRPTLNLQFYGAVPHNAGFDGEWSFGPVEQVNGYFEHSNEIGMNAHYPVGESWGTLSARVSGVYSLTTSEPDGPVCNVGDTTSQYTLESAYLGWKSGDLFPKLGHNAVEVSGGNQNYQVFDGLLFWDGGQDCAGRGGNWLSPRKAFRESGLLTLQYKNLLLQGVHLAYNDQNPNTHTRLGAARVEYVTDKLFMKHLKLGFMYFNIYDSQNEPRDGMDGIYLYHEATPLPSLPDFAYTTSVVREENSKSSGLSEAYGWYLAPSYQLSNVPWKPKLTYRYAWFSGGGTRGFDSLFTGMPEWGSWFQGELLGEYVLSNSNLASHQVRLQVKPTDILTLNLIYYKFLLDDRHQSFGLDETRVDRDLADEVDLIADLALTNWWSMTGTFSVAVPDSGFRNAVNGSSTWINGYLYMNFSF